LPNINTRTPSTRQRCGAPARTPPSTGGSPRQHGLPPASCPHGRRLGGSVRSGADWQVRRVAKDAIGYAGPSLPKNNVPVPLTTLVDHLRRVGCVARVAVGAPTICVHPRERAMASSRSDFRRARARALHAVERAAMRPAAGYGAPPSLGGRGRRRRPSWGSSCRSRSRSARSNAAPPSTPAGSAERPAGWGTVSTCGYRAVWDLHSGAARESAVTGDCGEPKPPDSATRCRHYQFKFRTLAAPAREPWMKLGRNGGEETDVDGRCLCGGRYKAASRLAQAWRPS
jgi:hypothetical protein